MSTQSDNGVIIAEGLTQLLSHRNKAGAVQWGDCTLRVSQEEALDAVVHFFKDGIFQGHIIQPGGVGKLHEIIALAQVAHTAGKKTLILVPSQYLVEKTHQRATELTPHMHIGMVYEKAKDYGQGVTVMTYPSMLQSIANGKIRPADYDLVLADEGHHYLGNLSEDALDKFPNAVKIAFTATPRYYAGKELAASRHFRQLFLETTLKQAIERGECTPTKVRMVDTHVPLEEYERLVTTSVKLDDTSALERSINKAEWNEVFATLYRTYKDAETHHTIVGDKAFIFCAGVQHAKDLAQRFNDALMPYINGRMKYTEEGYYIRETLEAKGIDPKHVKYACAPVWGAMDSEGGWGKKGSSTYTQREIREMYRSGEILTLSCDKLLAESIDIPETSVVFNAVPSFSFVRAGQRGMRSARTYNGDPVAKKPAKEWAYVFDALPWHWKESAASPVLFSEFTLTDLHTAHGVEPPDRMKRDISLDKTEKTSGFRVVTDIAEIQSIARLMEAKRITRAKTVPDNLINDSMAVKLLERKHGIFTKASGSRIFVSHLFHEWEQQYRAEGMPSTGIVSRYGLSIAAEQFHVINNRLYLDAAALPILEEEIAEFKSVPSLLKHIKEQGKASDKGIIHQTLDEVANFHAGTAARRSPPDQEQIRRNPKAEEQYQEYLKRMVSTSPGQVRYFGETLFGSVRLEPLFQELPTTVQERIAKQTQRRHEQKGWVNVASIVEDLTDLGFTGLSPYVLFRYAQQAANAAARNKEFGGEHFLESDFKIEVNPNYEKTKLSEMNVQPWGKAYIRGYRLESFIESLEVVHENKEAVDEINFPATVADCFPALRQIAFPVLTYQELNTTIRKLITLLSTSKAESPSDYRFPALRNLRSMADFQASDFICGKSPEVKITRAGFEKLKIAFSYRPPDHFIDADEANRVTQMTGEELDVARTLSMIKGILHDDHTTSDTILLAGIALPKKSFWKYPTNDGHAHGAIGPDREKIYLDRNVLPTVIRISSAYKKAETVLSSAIEDALKQQPTPKSLRIAEVEIPLDDSKLYINYKYGKQQFYYRDREKILDIAGRYLEQHGDLKDQPAGEGWSTRMPLRSILPNSSHINSQNGVSRNV